MAGRLSATSRGPIALPSLAGAREISRESVLRYALHMSVSSARRRFYNSYSKSGRVNGDEYVHAR